MSGQAFGGGNSTTAAAAAATSPASSATSDGVSFISEEARKFASLPEAGQRSLLAYPALVARAIRAYAETGSAGDAVHSLLAGCPEMLATVDNQYYRESALGKALLHKRLDACWRFVRLAEKQGTTQRVLRHRNSSGHTLLMLAVDFDCVEAAPLLTRLLDEWPEQVHTCYDADGRNVLHHCAADGRSVSLSVILNWVLTTASSASTSQQQSAVAPAAVAAAFGVPDGGTRLTPIHYLAWHCRLDMLAVVGEFAQRRVGDAATVVDFDRRWPGGPTPLMLAAEAADAAAPNVCQWLVRHGGANPRATMATAATVATTPLELAEAAGRSANAAALRQLLQEFPPVEAGDASPSPSPSSASGDGDDEDDDVMLDDENSADAAATEIGRLRVAVVGEGDLGRLGGVARRRLSAALRASGDGDSFVDALARRWPSLRASARPGGFLSLSADAPTLAVSLVAGDGGSVASLAEALRDIGRADLVPMLQLD